MKLKQFGKKHYELLMNIGFFLIFFYAYHCTLSDKIYPSSIVLFLELITALLCIFVANFSYINIDEIKKRKKLIIVLSILFILVINRNGDMIHGHLGQPFCIVFSIFLIFLLSFTDRWYKQAINITCILYNILLLFPKILL